MNLVKKGAVLFTALSAFALTSCGSKNNTMTYKQALEWVEKHYTKTESKGTITKSRVIWDYTKNVKGGTLPEQFPEPFKNADVDFFAAYALNEGFSDLGLTPEEMKKTSGDVTKDGTGYFDEENIPLNKAMLEETIGKDSRRHQYTFEVKNDCLIVARQFTTSREVEIFSGTFVSVAWTQTETEYFDKDGYPTTLKYELDNSDVVVKIKSAGETNGYELGELHLVVENEPGNK